MIYFVKYNSGWIGGIALISATDREHAAQIFNEYLKTDDWAHTKEVFTDDMKPFKNKIGNVEVLHNGDY